MKKTLKFEVEVDENNLPESINMLGEETNNSAIALLCFKIANVVSENSLIKFTAALTLILPSEKPLHDGFNDSIKSIIGESFNVRLTVILEVVHGANPLTVYVKL